jgi:hypothetical protein
MHFNTRSLFRLFMILSSILSVKAKAHTKDDPIQNNHLEFKLHKKSDIYINWGYNRSWFNNSDIHYTGQGHDFILYDVKASDRPSGISIDYVNPATWSIPQFNFRIGYFVSDKYSISIGWDHMKYVAEDFQYVKMYGFLDPSMVADTLMRSNMENMNAKYSSDGLYDNEEVQMTPDDFIHYEHTDGLNYASVDMERHFNLWQLKSHNKFGVSMLAGAGAGVIVPRTDSHIFGSGENHYWNLSGWGASGKIGLQISLLKFFYLQSDFKLGYLDMMNVHTSNHLGIDKATQNIVFYENYILLGFRF